MMAAMIIQLLPTVAKLLKGQLKALYLNECSSSDMQILNDTYLSLNKRFAKSGALTVFNSEVMNVEKWLQPSKMTSIEGVIS